jgi:capsular exopolysaccharide synthesis family protein
MTENNDSNKPTQGNQSLVPQSLDLMGPADRFQVASRLYVNLHRHQLLLRKFVWVLVVIALGTIVPAYLVTRATPQTYQSDARMWLAGKLDLSEGRLYTEELVNFLGTQADLIRSREVQERALASMQKQLTNAAPLKPALGALDVLRKMFGSAKTRKALDEAFPFKLKVTESSKSSMLELQARGSEPKSTQLFLKTVMDEYLNFKKESREKTSNRAVQSLAREVNKLADELKNQQGRVYEFQMSNEVVFLQDQGNSAANYLASLNRQLANYRTELQLLQMIQPDQWVELNARGHQNGAPAVEPSPGDTQTQDVMAGLSGSQADLYRANQQIHMLKAKREELSKVLRPMHPKIQKLDQDIAAQKKIIEVSGDETLKQLTNRRAALSLEVTNLEKAFIEWEGKTVDAGRKMADYERLRQDVQRTQAAYDRLLQVISTVDVGKSVDQENVSVLEPASMGAPVHMGLRNMALALVAATILGAAAVWLLGKFDDRFASSTELSEDFPEKVLGEVMDVRIRKQHTHMRPEVLAGQKFEFLESFRSIRSALYFMNQNGTRPKTLLITSSVPQEGKSTVALYLAATMAVGGARVLLVDGDMRKAKLHRHFGLASSPGLAEILNGELPPADAINGTSIPNLSFLAAGCATAEPGELVLRSQLNDFLSEVHSHFDYVILDSPPVLAADDAATLAPSVDGVLYVVRGTFTSARMVREGLDALRQRHAHVLGLIFNRALSSPFDYHPYHRYRDEYRWRPATAAA